MSKPKHAREILLFCVILVLVLVMIFSGLQILESTVLYQGQESEENRASKTIVRDGIAYFPRTDISVVMVLGIDQYGPVRSSESYNNPGDADVVMLLIFDEAAKQCNVLYLNRDTMLEMPVLGIGGKKAGTYYGQLALSHTYGTGLEDSCENTKEAVSAFLNGISIDYYLSMNMDAISLWNDAVDGVTVTVSDDFSGVDSTIPKGSVTLRGEQAVSFVRTRKDVGDQLNLSRIQRQKEYIKGFTEAFKAKQAQDPEFFLSAYDEASPYIVTNCSANAISGMLKRYSGYSLGEIVTPEGENVLNEYYEFYADEEKLDALILRLFYAQKG